AIRAQDRGERLAGRVRTAFLLDACGLDRFVVPPLQGSDAGVLEDWSGLAVADEETDVLVEATAERNFPILTALAVPDERLVRDRIKVAQVERVELRDAIAALQEVIDEEPMLRTTLARNRIRPLSR